MRDDKFIETRNYERVLELVDSLLTTSVGVDMAAVIAPYGRGKSEIAKNVVANNPRTVLVYFQGGESLPEMLREISFKVSKVRPRSRQDSLQAIRNGMRPKPKLIIMDEADKMKARHLNQLRALHDLYKTPIMLLGEQPLHDILQREGRLISRVRKVLHLDPIGLPEVVAFYRKAVNQAVTIDQAKALLRHSEGDFRRLMFGCVIAAEAMQKSGITEIDNAILQVVLKSTINGGAKERQQ